MSEQSINGRERYRRLTLAGGATAETWLQHRGEKIGLACQFEGTSGKSSGEGVYLRCSQQGCLGEALPQSKACFLHSTHEHRSEVLKQASASGRALCLRGTSISQSHWDQIAKSPLFEGNVLRAPINLGGAEFDAEIRMEDVTFKHFINFHAASIFKPIQLINCTFSKQTSFRYVMFDGGFLNCNRSTFLMDLNLEYSSVRTGTSLGFQGCTFKQEVNLDGLAGAIHLDGSIFQGKLTCQHSTAFLIMNGCDLRSTLDLTHSELVALRGNRIVAASTIQLGPCTISHLDLRNSTFNSRIHADLTANDIDLTGAVLREGGLLLVDKAKIRMNQLSLGRSFRISGRSENLTDQPEILGLLNSDAGQISLSRVNATRCSLVGAHGLGNLDFDSTVTFARGPFWSANRRFIADEYAWRSGKGRFLRFGWNIDGVHVGHSLPKPVREIPNLILLTPPSSAQVGTVYRELRRGLESKSDMPSAAGFYFGEMEMRRWSPARTFLDRVLIWGYWALSGYGLRPGRALIAWSLLVAWGASALQGLPVPTEPATIEQALLIAVRASIPGFSSEQSLSEHGLWIETSLRVVGTLLITLFVLSVRSIVMRKPGE